MIFSDLLVKERGLLKGPFGGDIKKAYFVPKGVKTFKVYEQGVVNNQDINFGNYYINEDRYNHLERFSVKTGDILITGAGTLGELFEVPEDHEEGVINQALIRLRINKDIVDNAFFKYYFKWYIKGVAVRYNNHSVIPNLPPVEVFKNIEVQIPDLPTQKKIADVLSCIDDKIALNNKTNSELENMAKTVYDYWFTQFDFPDANGNPYKTSGGKMEYNQVLKREIPVGWEVGKLSEIADIYNGSTPSTKENDNYGGDIVWITPKDLSDQQRKFTWYGERNITEKGYKDCNTTLIPEGSILLSSRAPIGLISIAACELCTNQGFKNIVPRNMENRYYLYSVIDSNIPKIEQLGSGTTFKEVSKQSMEDFKIIIPSEQIIRIYNEHIKPIFENQLKILMEIDELTKLRDYLLPLLMNGQIEVK